LTVLTLLALELAAFLIVRHWSRRRGWSALHVFAAGAGALLVYCWFGYTVEIALHGKTALVPHSMLMILVLALTGFAALRVYKREEST
jgi:hypothetical protein